MRALILTLTLLFAGGAVRAETTRVTPTSQKQVQLSFAPVVRQVVPAMVSVRATRATLAEEDDPFGSDPFFSQFFQGFGGLGRPKRKDDQRSLGSGVIVDAIGLIVTNNHVVRDAEEITVVLSDRRVLPAGILSVDEASDLAFLKVDPKGTALASIELGDSDAIEVGDLVLAIGNPFGVGLTVTSGIVSAEGRSRPDSDVSFIQTDAAINPGNSGGALVTLDGKLVGINSWIVSKGGGSVGIGFAIPANLVRARMARLTQGGTEAPAPWLGAKLTPVDEAAAEGLGLDRPRGVLVGPIYPDAAADKAGLRTGDVVLSVDGVEVEDPQGVAYRLALRGVGEQARLDVLRRGKETSLSLPLTPPPEVPAPTPTELASTHPLGGATIANMSPAFNEGHDMDPFARGVMIVAIERGSRVDQMRLRPGDVIVGIEGQEITTIAGLQRAIAQASGGLSFAIRRGARSFTLNLG